LILVFEAPCQQVWSRPALRRLPSLEGQPIRVQAANGLGGRLGAVHGGAFVRERRMAFDCTEAEFPRIFVHELFHFAWVRAGNGARWSFERMLREEWKAGARGELGWSAEWRKRALAVGDVRGRGRRWREYACESFCDTAAWLYAGLRTHAEFTLAPRRRERRRSWFEEWLENRTLPL
jgi:hypothetical protein